MILKQLKTAASSYVTSSAIKIGKNYFVEVLDYHTVKIKKCLDMATYSQSTFSSNIFYGTPSIVDDDIYAVIGFNNVDLYTNYKVLRFNGNSSTVILDHDISGASQLSSNPWLTNGYLYSTGGSTVYKMDISDGSYISGAMPKDVGRVCAKGGYVYVSYYDVFTGATFYALSDVDLSIIDSYNFTASDYVYGSGYWATNDNLLLVPSTSLELTPGVRTVYAYILSFNGTSFSLVKTQTVDYNLTPAILINAISDNNTFVVNSYSLADSHDAEIILCSINSNGITVEDRLPDDSNFGPSQSQINRVGTLAIARNGYYDTNHTCWGVYNPFSAVSVDILI